MSKSAAPTFRQMLAWLMTEIIFANANFAIMRGLKSADREVVNTAPTFFDMTIGTHADSVLLHAARLFDRRPGSVSIHTLLSSALRHAGTFRHGTAVEVRKSSRRSKALRFELRADPESPT